MKNRNLFWIIAGVLSLLGAVMHTFAGQGDIISPMMGSDLELRIKTELLGVWHTTTVVLFATSFVLLKLGVSAKPNQDMAISISWIYLLIALAFIGVSVINGSVAAQFVVFIPIAVLTLLGVRKRNKQLVGSTVNN